MERAELAEYARRVIDTFPPLTEDQKANLIRLFGTGRVAKERRKK